MRRFLVPVLLLAVAIAATFLATTGASGGGSADGDTEPAAATPVMNAARIPEWLQQPESDAALADAVLGVTTALPFGLPDTMCVAVARDGRRVVGHQAEIDHTPGEVQRVVTAAAALDVLPPSSRFTTEVVMPTTVAVNDGVLEGNIWVIGLGDPTLTSPVGAERLPAGLASSDLVSLADQTAAALNDLGVTAIGGSVVGDESRYAAERDYTTQEIDGGRTVWDGDDLTVTPVGPLSALLVDNGFTFSDAGATRVADPAAQAAGTLAFLLLQRGIGVAGLPTTGDAPDTHRSLATVESAPRADVVTRSVVDPTTAEMLFKEIGVRGGGQGDRGSGTITVFRTIEAMGLAPGLPVDGSGASDANLVSCATLGALLEHEEHGETIREALPPIAETPFAACAPPEAGDLRVLGTTAENTVSLVGGLTSDNGDRLSFAMIANNTDSEPLGALLGDPCNELTATLLEAVAGHPYEPGVDLLPPS